MPNLSPKSGCVAHYGVIAAQLWLGERDLGDTAKSFYQHYGFCGSPTNPMMLMLRLRVSGRI
jgi:hypothetical protein